MSFKRALRILFCGLLRLFRTLTALAWRVLRWRYTPQISMSDDECEYDSTWEDEDENKTPRNKMFHSHMSRRNTFAAKDMQNFRHSCRGLDNISDDDDGGEQDEGCFYNLEFYRGEIRSSPDDLFISDYHQRWWGKYDMLEDVHSYIQWLFPIQEPGMNRRAYVLSKKEIKLFRKDEEAKKKLVKSYELMLDFYGIRLVDKSTGKVARAQNWDDRFRNLNRYTHNNLRITRILKCLGTLGLKQYQAPLVEFFLYETLVKKQLKNVKQSALDYFMFAVLDKSERRKLVTFAFENFEPRKHFIWGPTKILSGQVAHCKNKTMDQPTESKESNITEDKHKMNKLEARNPPKEMQSKKDHQDEPVISNTLTEANSNQGAKLRSSENEVGVDEDNKNISPRPDVEMGEVTKDEQWENEQKRDNSTESTHKINKIDGNHLPEETESKKDNKNKDKTVIPKNLTETNSDREENKNIQCSSENGENDEMSVSDDDRDGVGINDDNGNTAPDNKSHGHDASGGSHQTEEDSSCQVSNALMKDETENKESEDKQKGLNHQESKQKIEKTEAGHSPEEMNSNTDITETNNDLQATDSSQCSSVEDVVKQNDEMSDDSVSVTDNDNKKTALAGQDATPN